MTGVSLPILKRREESAQRQMGGGGRDLELRKKSSPNSKICAHLCKKSKMCHQEGVWGGNKKKKKKKRGLINIEKMRQQGFDPNTDKKTKLRGGEKICQKAWL